MLKDNFIPCDVNAISQIPISNGDRKDTIMWNYDEKGVYTVKSGYWIGHNLMSTPCPSIVQPSVSWWTFLWKLWIPLKVKIFMWKAYHDWIPTKINIARGGVQTSGICDASRTCDETTLHALWECNKLKSIRSDWSNLVGKHVGRFANFFELMVDRASPANRKDAGLFCIVVWRIWDWYNPADEHARHSFMSKLYESGDVQACIDTA
ncbi:hypothetical protein Dsin_025215 [Dipteronia sinensis]|uniref:Reverse transcriptase zinc-binding domain-containing protein n=1 Tax=Dipteronia sinensis TaxID=43782 RepID=A0AAE0DWK5_9ROSI|nr:hypothetical protein Dsin_025215 [Dipteronia sinensis]